MIPHSFVISCLFCLNMCPITLGLPSYRPQDTRNLPAFVPDSAQRYLTSFGYLPQSDLEVGNLRSEEELRNAIKQLQRFAGLPQTGEIDGKTKRLMETPRCGLPDVVGNEGVGGRRKRYILQGQKWPRTDLTWTITNFTTELTHEEVRDQLTRALDIWGKESKLTFTYVPPHKYEDPEKEADIVVAFHKGYHGDGYPFDGEGKILAHAFFPGTGRGGDAHFDDEEKWRSNRNEGGGMSLFAVAAHEFGHSLGLSHSSVEKALMYPWYRGFSENMPLPTDDKYGIWQLYGSREGAVVPLAAPDGRTRSESLATTTTTTTTTVAPPRSNDVNDTPLPTLPPGKPDLCDTAYDAVAVIRQELYVFKGPYFWRKGKDGLYSETPTEIARFWYGLPQNTTRIDAIYERLDQRIVIFIGRKYWVYEGNTEPPGYPKDISDLWLPDNLDRIDAAMVWGHNSKTYFFSGTMYWRFDEDVGHVELDYPRDMSTWGGVPYELDAATQWLDGKTYFFKGKSFYEFDDLRFRVTKSSPYLSAPFWMGCPTGVGSKSKLAAVPHSLGDDDERVGDGSGAWRKDQKSTYRQTGGAGRQVYSNAVLLPLFYALLCPSFLSPTAV